ncbi:single-stranded DNA-binding protein [Campylobacter curvus]|uniref:single-stranded DNA-binding protein n=1 Tax=Campylobacter curvus TaxID=200 RepID=UPI0014707ED7
MFNRIVLVGNLTKDIELRYTQGGATIGSSGIAVTRKYTLNGEKREETCFIDISFFGKQAEIANQYLNKGSKLLIEGRLKFEQWTDNNGQNRSKHSISVENMEMLGDGQGGNSSQSGGYSQGSNSGYQSRADNHWSKSNQGYQSNKKQTNQAPNSGNQSQNGTNRQANDQANYDDSKYYANDETIPF